MTNCRTLSVLWVATSLLSCRAAAHQPMDGSPAGSPPAQSSAAGSTRRGAVRLDAGQLKQVRIEELTRSAPAEALKATGSIEFDADRMSKLLPPVSGQVQHLTVNVGDAVRKNDVLFVLSSREVAAALAEHATSQRDLDLASKTLAMTQDLFEHGVASRISLQQAESDLAKAKSKVRETDEVLRVLGLDPPSDEDEATRIQARVPVRAPLAGTVIERSVTDGQFVGSENGPLITIADLSSVWVQADVFERDLRYISTGQRADVTTAAYPAEHFGARVARIGSVVDPQTRTAKVRFIAANPGARLKPGMFASVSLYLPAESASLTVPAKAAFVENSRTFAYVQVGPAELGGREIETQNGGADRLRVVRGLKAGDRVISDGVLLLRQLEADSNQ